MQRKHSLLDRRAKGGEERRGVFGVSRGDAAPSFQMQKGVFHQMAHFVERFIVRSLNGAIFLRRNHGFHALSLRLPQQGISIIAPIREQIICA